MRLLVQYELEAQISSVIVQLVCRSEDDQNQVFMDRLNNPMCKKVKKLEESDEN